MWFGKGGLRLRTQQQILTRLKIGAIIVCEDLIPFFVPQFTNPARPLAYTTSDFAQVSESSNPHMNEEVLLEAYQTRLFSLCPFPTHHFALKRVLT
jgi:hypothetical protein